ncbi:hypothetical protein [Methanoculleus horonobensis]|uniref:hypothetical protein n=1 Tax=Methanoculleus horonobensis TaxID=528314 RepID=UPI0008346CE1|nr:hypothetical protein [Methanoculleus horonobensis]
MSNKFETKFEEVLYVILVDYAAKTLNSEEIAPKFKSRAFEERRAIKEVILKELQEAVKKIGKEISEQSLSDPQMIVTHKEEVKKIITQIIGRQS